MNIRSIISQVFLVFTLTEFLKNFLVREYQLIIIEWLPRFNTAMPSNAKINEKKDLH